MNNKDNPNWDDLFGSGQSDPAVLNGKHSQHEEEENAAKEANVHDMHHWNYNGTHAWKKYGFLQSKNHGANPISLDVDLNKLLQLYKKRMQQDETMQEEMKRPIRKKIEGLKIDIQNIEQTIANIRMEKIPLIEKEKDHLKSEIGEVRRDPSFYKEKPNWAALIITIIVLVLLTLYLWIFYTSASYSAFFRQFAPDDINVANSIFDPNALRKAWNEGGPALILVTTMPFIFLGLGVLIHKVQEQEGRGKWFKLAALIITTFLFDYIIAYEIVKKIHDLQALNNPEMDATYRFGDAVSDPNFWLIIFAGFVTYLIWGFLFDRLMHDTRKMDHAGEQIRVRKREIMGLDKAADTQQSQIDQLRQQTFEKQKEISDLEQDLTATFIRPREFEYIVYQFASGWMQYIEGGMMGEQAEKNDIRSQTRDVVLAFVQKNNNPVLH
jgi:succinate dehydrogenase hydrophobic anchor subunit